MLSKEAYPRVCRGGKGCVVERGSTLKIKTFMVDDVGVGSENRVTADGSMTVDPGIAKELADSSDLLADIGIRIIKPDQHDQYTNTLMDVIPISTKALGKIGEGVTFTLGGVYVILTGIDEAGRQISNFGSSEGIISEKMAFGRAGTPDETDTMIFFDVTVKEGMWADRKTIRALHTACDSFIQIFRDQMKKFNGRKCTESVTFQEEYVPGRKDIAIYTQVSGQGAVYETTAFGAEPCGVEGAVSVIDMHWMPVVFTPNEFRDGVLHAMD